MGIDDRDYMRERPSWQPPPRVTRAPLEYAGHPPHSPVSRRVSLDYDPDEVEGVQRVRPWRLT
ncbi:MAG: hypothetical protein ACXVZ1_06980, partial [Gaiellaceae bacterium]